MRHASASRRFTLAVLAAILAGAPRGARAQEVHAGPAGEPAPALPAELPVPATVPGVVSLHVETAAPKLELHLVDGWILERGARRPYRRLLSHVVCLAPCDRVLDARPTDQYFFTGPDVTRSSFFDLHDRSGPITAHVVAGSNGTYETAAPIIGLGGFGLAAGSLVVGWGLVDRSEGGQGAHTSSAALEGVGAGLLVAGAATVILGVVRLIRGTTRFELSPPAAAGR